MSFRPSDWFNKLRYGMFIHWGAYSVAGRGEWIMNRECIPQNEYTRLYVDNWKAEKYDPAKWVELAKAAGMGYMVFTTRHHDGLALWNSSVNNFNTVNYGPKKDLVAPYVKAVRDAGLKVGLYYSPASWTHPDYPGSTFRDWPGKDDWKSEESRQRFIEYYREELKELLDGSYGDIDYLWFDGCIPENIDGDETMSMLREMQPQMLINNRLGKPHDIKVCEQTINPPKENIDWEACFTLNENWGYHAGDDNWRSPRDVIRTLLTCAQSCGNLLLNVGPMGSGELTTETISILTEAGVWVRANWEAIDSSSCNPFSWNCTGRPITVKGKKVYIHFLINPKGEFCWAETKSKLQHAYFLCSGHEIRFIQKEERIFLTGLPDPLPDELGTTVVLEFDDIPQVNTEQTTFWIPE